MNRLKMFVETVLTVGVVTFVFAIFVIVALQAMLIK